MRKLSRVIAVCILAFLIVNMYSPLSLGFWSGPAITDAGAGIPAPDNAKISPSLQKVLERKGDQDIVTVAVWLHSDATAAVNRVAGRYPQANLLGGRPSKATPLPMFRQFDRESRAARVEAIEKAQYPILQLARGSGYKIRYASKAAPLVFLDVPKGFVAQLGGHAEVDTIYPSLTFRRGMDTVVPTLRVKSVWDGNITGAGQRIAVVELPDNGGGKVDLTHPDLKPGDLAVTNYYNPDDNVSEHATFMAGVIGGQNEFYRGIAYGAKPLLSGNAASSLDLDVIAAADWAIGLGTNTRGGTIPDGETANIINNSYHSEDTNGWIEAIDRYFDYISLHFRVTVVTSSGNRQIGENWYAGNPGLSYNSITVGAYRDFNGNLVNVNQMLQTSRFGLNPLAPPFNGRTKPEVVAVGAHMNDDGWGDDPDIVSTYPANTYNTNGLTSAAAAETSGIAALVLQADQSGQLSGWPEAVKAIIMASAIHNIEGSRRLSDHDGAGGVDAQEAVRVTQQGQWTARYIEPGDWQNGSFDYPIQATQGQRVRVVITWPSHTDVAYPYPYNGNPELQTNLDLRVFGSNQQNPADSSTSVVNNYEIVDFLATEPGTYTYTARVNYTSFTPGTTEYVGFAYSVSKYNQPQVAVGWQAVRDPNSGVVYAPITVRNFLDLSTNTTTNNQPIDSYAAMVRYDPNKIQIVDVLGNNNFAISNIQSDGQGHTTFNGTRLVFPPPAPPDLVVANLVVRLNGSAWHIDAVEFVFTSINSTPDPFQEPTFYRWYQRGDASNVNNPNPDPNLVANVQMGDALAISQYLAGLITFDQLDGVNAATPRHDGTGGDIVTIVDAMFISQYLVGLRDDKYNIPGLSAAAMPQGQAGVSIGSAQVAGSARARIPVSVTIANSAAGLGAYDLQLSYNPQVLNVVSVDAGDAPFGKPAAVRIDNTKGIVQLNGFLASTKGVDGSTVLAYLNVKAATNVGTIASVGVKVKTLSDVFGNDFLSVAPPATITIK